MTPNGVDPAFSPGAAAEQAATPLFVGAVQRAQGPARRGGRGGAARHAARRRRARNATLRLPTRSEPAVRTCAATSLATSSSSSTAARRRSCCRRGTRASGCRCSRRWRAARRSSHRRRRAAGARGRRGHLRRAGGSRRGARARPRRSRPARRRGPRARAAVHLGRDGAANARRLPRGARVRTAAVVVSHGNAARARAPAPGARAAGRRARRRRERAGQRRRAAAGCGPHRESAAARVRRQRQPRVRSHDGRARLFVNPDTVPREGAVSTLARRSWRRVRAPASPGRRCSTPTGPWQPSRRRFPTVAGTLVRRTPLRLLFDPYERQRRHYHLDETPVRARTGGLDARRLPDAPPQHVRRARRLRRGVPSVRRGHRPLLPRLATPGGSAGTSRRRSSSTSTRRSPTGGCSPVGRSGTGAGSLRFVRKHPERLRAL